MADLFTSLIESAAKRFFIKYHCLSHIFLYFPLDILISCHGHNEVAYRYQYAFDNIFLHPYQDDIGRKLKKYTTASNTIHKIHMKAGISNPALYWLHFEHMIYAMCKELKIKFYAIYQPNFVLKKNKTIEDRILSEYLDGINLLEDVYLQAQSKIREKSVYYPWLIDFSGLYDNIAGKVFRDEIHLTDYGSYIFANKVFELIRGDLR